MYEHVFVYLYICKTYTHFALIGKYIHLFPSCYFITDKENIEKLYFIPTIHQQLDISFVNNILFSELS